MAKNCYTSEQAVDGTIRPQYSEVESPKTNMSKVGNVADVPMDNPSPSEYYSK